MVFYNRVAQVRSALRTSGGQISGVIRLFTQACVNVKHDGCLLPLGGMGAACYAAATRGQIPVLIRSCLVLVPTLMGMAQRW